MLKHKDAFHGSDLEKIEAIYGIKREEIVSFSQNCNPLGISYKLRDTLAHKLDAIMTYPEREYTKLRECISKYTNAQIDHIIVGNGTSELISLFIQTQHPKKALILGPTYSEYEREIGLAGGVSKYYPLDEENDFTLDVNAFCQYLNDSIDLLVLCSPNNPTSNAITRKQMRKILDTCLKHGIFVMVDETYAEFADNEQEISCIKLTNSYSNLIILRGTSKFFCAPGLRLGYAITGNRDVFKAINTRKNPWSINSLAELAGQLMFQDEEYIRQTKELISSERKRVYEELSTWENVKVFKPSGNFMLMKILKEDVTSDMLFEHCVKQKMMIRDCASFPFLDNSYVRFCFMSPEDNDRLLKAFAELLKS